MSFLKRVQRVELLTRRNGGEGVEGVHLTGFLADKVERQGAAFGWGYLKGRYRERFTYRGYGMDGLVGGGLVVLGALLNAYTGGRNPLAGHLERVGDSGLQSYVNSLGVSMGTKHAGRTAVVVDQSKKLPTKQQVVGVIPPAVAGPYLSADDIARLAQPR